MSQLANIQRRGIVIIIMLLAFSAKGFSQLSAGFSATTVSGCAPIVVQFNDQSTGNPTQWEWDLGNGVVSYLQNPSATYFNPGTYHVKLIVRNGSAVDSVVKSNYITVYPNPEIDFKASDTAGCFPLPVQFTDLSTTKSGTLANWSWDFGDGVTSTLSNPTHTYTTAGNYSVTLKLTNSYGCTKTYSKSQYIRIGSGVTADFSNNNPGLCKAPVTIKFTNKSSGPGSLSYYWDFGDGMNSNEASPSHTYTAAGNYTVKLITTSSQGCVDTLVKTNLISVGAVSSSFSSPDTVCTGQAFTLTNTSTPAPGLVAWSFGDGATSTQTSPVKVYSNAGIYTIKLVNDFGGCKDSVSKKVVVKARQKPAFTAQQTTGCKTPFTVSFTNTTTGNNTYKWLFGDGATSTEAQPQHTYTSLGSYTVTLIAFNSNGCSDTLIRQEHIKVQKPTISINGLMKTGCTPLQVLPTASIASTDPVTGYLWKFGDGATSTDARPSHTYTTPGNYDVTLVVTTASGCSDSVVTRNAVRIGDKPEAKFSINPVEACASTPISFTDNSTGKVDEWLWLFGDKLTSNKQNPTHVFQETGVLPVTLIVKSNTCPDTLVINDAVDIKPPIAKFAVAFSCNEKFTKVFTDKSTGATTWDWEFGDGATSTERSPSHTYAAPGTYAVILRVTNGSCNNSYTQTVKVIDEKAVFTPDQKTVCKGSAIRFATQNTNPANISKTAWNFGDGSATASGYTVAHTYTKAGKYTVTLTITDILGCITTHSEEVTIYGPMASFFPSVAGACLYNNMVSFADSSKTDGVNSIVKRVWNFGDGFSDSTSAMPYQHQYTKAGEYSISLKVVDSYGCSDIITKQSAVVIAQPRANFISPDSLSCTDKPIRFINRSAGYALKYEWTLGDGQVSKTASPTYSYKATGLYTVGLVVTDKYGCKDSLKKTDYINISYPSASFAVSDSFGTCPPLLVNFTNASTHYTNLSWSFDDGNTSVKQDPSHYYTMPGIYNARLVVSGPGGCKDSVSKRIEVRGPKGALEYDKLIGCAPVSVSFKANTTSQVSILWDFSDGTTVSSKEPAAKHTYTRGGSYLPKMILTDAAGCSVPIAGKDTIKVVEVTAKFEVDNRQLCDSGMVKFKDLSIGNEAVRSWQWIFGDGKSANTQHPAYHYTTPGSFTAKLIAITASGCKDTATMEKQIEVYQSPVITVAGNLEACMPATLAFKGNVVRENASSLKWDWSFGNGQTSSLQHPAEQLYTKDGAYQLRATVTDEHGCNGTVSKVVTIHPLPAVDAGKDVLLCRDDSIRLNATGADTYNWDIENSLTCISCDKPYANPTATTIYHVTGYNKFGCSNVDSVKVTVRQKFSLNVGANDSICAGGSAIITASGADKYTWSPTTGLDNANLANPKARPATSTLYTVVARDNDDCFAQTATVFVKVNPIPSIEAGNDLTIPAGSSVQINTSSSPDVINWQWAPAYNLSCTNCSTPTAAPNRTTKYAVTVKNAGGCSSTDHVTVSVVCKNGNLFIPNTFSPNNDGNNDRFYPRGTGIGMVRSFRVFNRWGEVVFERLNFNVNDAAAGWDGTFKGQPLTPDVFIYSCEVVCLNNEVLPFTGDIMLIR